MKLVYINPNSTVSMTEGIVAAARSTMCGIPIEGITNGDGPAAIEGPADGDAAVPGVLARLAEAEEQGASAVIIACFDDTGLAMARAQASCPVLGIGQSAYVMASLLGLRFSVVTSLAVSVPVIEDNISNSGFAEACASVRPSGLPVLTIDEGAPETLDRIADEIGAAQTQDGAQCAILGCAGMAPLMSHLKPRTRIPLIDGVTASVHLAIAAAAFTAGQ